MTKKLLKPGISIRRPATVIMTSIKTRLEMIATMKRAGHEPGPDHPGTTERRHLLIEGCSPRRMNESTSRCASSKPSMTPWSRAILSIEAVPKSSLQYLLLEYIDRRFAWGIPCSYNFYQDDVTAMKSAAGAAPEAGKRSFTNPFLQHRHLHSPGKFPGRLFCSRSYLYFHRRLE